MTDKNLVKDIINKSIIKFTTWDFLIQKLYEKGYLIFCFVYLWKNSHFIMRISRTTEKSIYYEGFAMPGLLIQ